MPDQPLTILQLTHHGTLAGSTQSIFSLSQELARRGHRVLVGCREGVLLARLARDAGLPVVPLEFGALARLARSLAEVIARERVDLVNSHDTRDRRALTWSRWRGVLPQAFVVTRRTMPLTSPAELLAVGLTADRTIAVSPAVEHALRRRGHPPGRLTVVPNGIALARVDSPLPAAALRDARSALGDAGERAVVVVVARLKDQHVLLAALARVRRPVLLALIGIDANGRLAELARTVPPRHRVVFVPATERALAFYHLAHVAALPSRIEGFSQSLLEAMALGIPVIASDAGGNPDLVTSGENGLLVAPLDPTAWASALERVLDDAAFARRIAGAGRALVRETYTMEHTAARTEEVYRHALARRRPRGTPSGS